MSEDLASAWKGHPCTRKLRKHLEGQRRLAMEELMNKAKVSSDPEVRAAYARHEAVNGALSQVLPQSGADDE